MILLTARIYGGLLDELNCRGTDGLSNGPSISGLGRRHQQGSPRSQIIITHSISMFNYHQDTNA